MINYPEVTEEDIREMELEEAFDYAQLIRRRGDEISDEEDSTDGN